MQHHDAPSWEYTAIPVENSPSLVDALNRLGGEGWELAAIVDSSAILKRPTPGLRDIVTAEQRERALQTHGAAQEPAL